MLKAPNMRISRYSFLFVLAVFLLPEIANSAPPSTGTVGQ